MKLEFNEAGHTILNDACESYKLEICAELKKAEFNTHAHTFLVRKKCALEGLIIALEKEAKNRGPVR